MTVCKESCIFQSCASSPNNARSREAQAPASWSCGLWWKESSPWEDWFVTWQVFRITTDVENERGERALCCVWYPTCNFFLEYDPRFSVAPFQLWPERTPKSVSQYTFTFLTKRFNAVLSIRTTRVRVPLARNPSPLQYPTLYVHEYSVRSLLRQPRSALEAGPS